MTKKNIVTALALGFLAFVLSSLPVTTAEAVEPIVNCNPNKCETCIATRGTQPDEKGGPTPGCPNWVLWGYAHGVGPSRAVVQDKPRPSIATPTNVRRV